LCAGNGYITTTVLREILKELDDKLTAEDLDLMIEEIDSDGSGTVDFDGKLKPPENVPDNVLIQQHYSRINTETYFPSATSKRKFCEGKFPSYNTEKEKHLRVCLLQYTTLAMCRKVSPFSFKNLHVSATKHNLIPFL
jgi:hypothetical protein